MATKPQLSREYVYVPMANMNFDLGSLSVHDVAFLDDPGVAPADEDWVQAQVVPNDLHELWLDSAGPSLTVLVGPERGDTVDTLDLAAGDYQVWVDVGVTGSDERVVRRAGTLTVSVAG